MKKGWQDRRLGDVCEIIKGRKPALKNTRSNGDLPYLEAKVMRGSQVPKYAAVADRNSVTVSEAETIIICDGSNSGEVFWGFHGVLSSTMGKIAKKAEIDDSYLRAFLSSTFEFFNGSKTGAAIPHLDKEAMYALQLPVPPLPEQQRIVRILDEAFEGIATAKANAERNLQNARALFESHLQFIFARQNNGWIEMSVGELVAEGTLVKPFDGNHGEIHPTKSDYMESGVPFIMACDLRNGSVDTEHCKFISRKLADSLRVGFAKDGDVLISHKGTIGRSAIVRTDDDYIMLTPQVTSYRVKDASKLDNRFIRYYFMSPAFQREIAARAADGSTRAYIGITKQLSLRFRFPGLSEQKRISAELDALEPECQRLVALYERKYAALVELKKAVLQEAFMGIL